jgi:hypothetical protein
VTERAARICRRRRSSQRCAQHALVALARERLEARSFATCSQHASRLDALHVVSANDCVAALDCLFV